MGRSFLKQTAEILRTKQRRKHLKRAMVSLSVIVAMLTSYLLILPAVTMERDPICGQEEHTHTDECYEHRLICGKTEQDGQAETTQRVLSCAFTTHVHSESCYNADGQLICGYADYAIHTHDENCYDADGNLVCTLPEVKQHGHDGSCYATETVLACGQDESSVQTIEESNDPFSDGTDVFGSGDNNVYVGDSEGGHTHTEECYETKYTLTCGKDEIIPHTHTAECYDENGNLVCGRLEIQEHQHDENCFMTVTTEAVEGHTHTDECYEDVLICDKAEHVHTEECYPQEEAEDEVAEGDAEAADEAVAEETGEEVAGEEATAEEDAQEDVDTVEDAEVSEEEADTAEETEAAEEEEDSDLVAMEPAVEYICGKEEHTHGEGCWDEEGNLICGMEEHVHDETCLPEADDEEAEEEPVVAKILTAEGSDYTVEVTYTDEAQIPDNAVLSVREIEQGTEEYESYYQQAVEAVQGGDTSSLAFARFFDISFVVDGTEIEPAAAVAVKISYKDAVDVPEGSEVKSVHFGEETEVLDVQTNGADGTVEEVAFDANGFSVYGIVGTETLTTQYITAEGDTYTITVTYDKDAEIPEGATLEVSELANDNKEYTNYVEQAAKALAEGEEVPFVNAARLFDISIMADGKKVEPKAPVEVKIEYANAENLNETSEVGAVHFKESTFKTETEVMDVNVQGEEGKVDGVTFTTDSFSIYAVIIIDKEAGTFVFEDNDYKVTVTYTKEANIPIGTELTVEEIDSEEDQYWDLRKQLIEKINEGVKRTNLDEPDPRKGITDAVFFDVSLNYEGKEIEPDVPLEVQIEYKKSGIVVPEGESTGVVHFGKETTEIIKDIETEVVDIESEKAGLITSYKYEQGGFSPVGNYSTGEYIEIESIDNTSVRALAAPPTRASSITASKDITDEDGDGVYELALSVTGQSESSSQTNVDKSNVVIVIDVSGSMDYDVYSEYTYSASTYDSSTTYYGYRNNQYIQVWRNGNNWYRTRQWDYRTQTWTYSNPYNDTVYTQTTRLEATKAAASALVDALLANNKDQTQDGVSLRDIIEISLVKFAGNNEKSFGGWNPTYYNGTETLVSKSTNATVLKNAINGLTAGGGTNWEMALQQAKSEADVYKDQTGETTSVIFLTDGKPTLYGSNDNGDGQEGDSNVRTCWNAASDDARTIVTSGYNLYSIFAFGTDSGTNSGSNYLKALTNYAYTGNGSYTNYDDQIYADGTKTEDYFYNATSTQALIDAFQKIIDKINKAVGYGGITVDDGVTTGVTNTSVTVDGSVNASSFKYSISSGETTLVTVHIEGNTATFKSGTSSETQTVTGTNKTVTIDGTDHTNTLFEAEIDGVKYRMCPARMDEETGEIVWELAPVGIIENGYTYELTLDVWPNQLAFDMVADLNNGVKTKEEIKADIIRDKGQDVWDQIDAALVGPDGNGKYYVKTNWQEYVDYYTVDTEVDSEGHETTVYTPQERKQLGPKDPVVLTSSEMDLRKIWEDTLDQDQLNELLWNEDGSSKEYSVTLHIWKADSIESLNNLVDAGADNTWYLTKNLGWNAATNQYDSFAIDDVTGQRFWEKTLDVAPGTMIELTKARDEMGIDVEGLKQVTYGSKTYVVLESGHYYTVTEDSIDRHFELNTIVYHPMLVDGVLSNVTFKADGSVESIVPMSTVDAVNTLKGSINVQKKVFDGEGDEMTEVITSDDTFKVKITMQNADGTPYENWDYRIYYGQNNPNLSKGQSDHNYGLAGNGGFIEVDLYIGDVIRIINVPDGVTYSVEETEYDDAIYSIGANYTFPITTGVTEKKFTTNESGISYMISKGESDNFVVDSDQKVQGNAASQAVVVNKVPTARIKLLKVGDSTTSLDGVKFKIFYDEECTKPVTKDATGVAIPGIDSNGVITTDADGYAVLGTLAGTYYFQEISTKDGYNMLTAPVRVKVEKDNNGEKVTASCTEEGVILNTLDWISKENDGIWVVKVNNSTGMELPHTGGSGTLPYTLGGLMLMSAAALMYGFIMRRRGRRLN